MAQNYNYPSSSEVTISGIGNPTGQPTPNDAVYIAGELPSGDLEGISLTADRELRVADEEAREVLLSRLSGSLVPAAYDSVVLTYYVSGNGNGQIETVTYNLLGAPVAVLTLSYNGSGQLSSVVKS